MQSWPEAIFHYARPEQLVDRLMGELVFLLLIPIFAALEVYTSGWRESTMGILRRPGRSGWWDIVSLLAHLSGIRKILANFFFFGLIAYIGFVMGDFTLGLLADHPAWIQLSAAVLLLDFLQYWNHRIRHTNNWIWLVHEFHHSSTCVNLLTSYRVHPIDNLVRILTIAVPFQLVVGLDIQNSLVVTLFSALPGIYSHARIDRDFGWLGRYLLVTPRFHQLHHAIDKKKFVNYGHAFVIWDRIFGSYMNPDFPIAGIEQGIEDNFYERESPVKAFLRPVWKFYAFPFRWAVSEIKRISPARNVGR